MTDTHDPKYSCIAEQWCREHFPDLCMFYHSASTSYQVKLLHSDNLGYLDVTPPGFFTNPAAVWGTLQLRWNGSESARADCVFEHRNRQPVTPVADPVTEPETTQTEACDEQPVEDVLAAIVRANSSVWPVLVDAINRPVILVIGHNRDWYQVSLEILAQHFPAFEAALSRLCMRYPALVSLLVPDVREPLPALPSDRELRATGSRVLVIYQTTLLKLLELRFGETQLNSKLASKPKLPAVTGAAGWVLRLLGLTLDDAEWRQILNLVFTIPSHISEQ